MRKKSIWVLALGHLVTDLNQGALPAMLPFFISAHDLSYTAAATVVFAANLASSIVQPVFGYAADRFSIPWLLCAGLAFAGMGLGLTGLCESYPVLIGLAVISGTGVAAYHPEAARLVNFDAGDQKNTAMSIFGVGGTIGFAAGPVLVTTAILQWGTKGTLILILPVAAMAVFMATQLQKFKSIAQRQTGKTPPRSPEPASQNSWAFIRLTLVVIGRSVIFYGLNTFIPLYWIHHFHQSQIQGSLALTAFAGSGVLGHLAGGHLADKIGAKTVLLTGLTGLIILLPLFNLVHTPETAMLLMFPIGFALYTSYSPSIVMGQSYLPGRVGVSSGITLGLAVSAGGATAPLIGKIADLYGVWYGMTAIACLPACVWGVAVGLPETRTNRSI